MPSKRVSVTVMISPTSKPSSTKLPLLRVMVSLRPRALSARSTVAVKGSPKVFREIRSLSSTPSG